MISTKKNPGFSMMELLITLALLGVLAAFTVPQLFMTSSTNANTKYTKTAHDVALMVATAYERYKVANPGALSANTQFRDLVAYMNYVKLDTSNSTIIDEPPTGMWRSATRRTCGTQFVGTHYCYFLHNGAVMWYNTLFYFAGANTTNAIWFNFDPDGSGPADALQFWLTYDGYVYTVKNLPTTMTMGYIFSTSTQSPTTQDASWFNGF
jgi:prepilin-type N-terminal cleavage/methylation domain-containing protein